MLVAQLLGVPCHNDICYLCLKCISRKKEKIYKSNTNNNKYKYIVKRFLLFFPRKNAACATF